MRRLKNLSVHEISLVNRAANKKKFLITKSAGGAMAETPQALLQRLTNVPREVTDKLLAISKTAFEKGDSQVTLTPQQQDALTAVGRILSPHMPDMPMAAIAQMLEAVGADGVDAFMDADDFEEALDDDGDADVVDADDQTPAEQAAAATRAAMPAFTPTAKSEGETEDEAMSKADDKKMTLEECKKKAQGAYDELMKANGFGGDKKGEDVPPKDAKKDDKDKAPPWVKKDKEDAEDDKDVKKSADVGDGEDIFKSHANLKALHAEAIAKTAELQTRLDRQEMIQKAAELPHLGKANDIADLLVRTKKHDPEGFEAQFALMKSWNAQADGSPVFQETGSSRSDNASGAEARIAAAVDSLVQKSGTMTPEQAYTHFVTKTDEGKALMREYRAEAEILNRRS